MTNELPEKRLDVKKAIDKIEKFGDHNIKKQSILGTYVKKIKEKLTNDKSSISIDEDIE